MYFNSRNFILKVSGMLCALGLLFVAGASQAQATSIAKAGAEASVGGPGYSVSVFAKGTSAYTNPDSVDVTSKYVFIGYQNVTAKDGSDNKSSTIVQYTLGGKVVHTFSVLGHNDGLRYNPATKLLWSTSNEDGNPRIVTIDPATGVITPYTFAKTPHGGGYDDVIFVNGNAFIAASNPTLNSAGVNVNPALDEIELKNGQAILTPILMGDANAVDVVSKTTVTLNLTDPDSLMLDLKGNLVLDDQADAQIITIHNPGTSSQSVTRLTVGTQVDDSYWIPSAKGKLVVVDGKNNIIYTVKKHGGFTPGTIYTEAPSDSGVAGFVGTIDPATGTTVPVIVGLGSPTGLSFIP
jgi:hypothetical protein